MDEEQDKKERKITLRLIISWVLGIFAGIAGITYLFSEPMTGALFILTALVLLPPVGEFLKKKYNFSLSGGLKVVIVIILLIIIGTVTSGGDSLTGTLIDSNESSSENTTQKNVASVEVVDVSTKVTESNSVWWKYAWILTLKNNTDKDQSVTGTLEWVDADGFVVDSATAYSLVIPAGEEKIFNDFALIDSSVAGNIDGVEAEISR